MQKNQSIETAVTNYYTSTPRADLRERRRRRRENRRRQAERASGGWRLYTQGRPTREETETARELETASGAGEWRLAAIHDTAGGWRIGGRERSPSLLVLGRDWGCSPDSPGRRSAPDIQASAHLGIGEASSSRPSVVCIDHARYPSETLPKGHSKHV